MGYSNSLAGTGPSSAGGGTPAGGTTPSTGQWQSVPNGSGGNGNWFAGIMQANGTPIPSRSGNGGGNQGGNQSGNQGGGGRNTRMHSKGGMSTLEVVIIAVLATIAFIVLWERR